MGPGGRARGRLHACVQRSRRRGGAQLRLFQARQRQQGGVQGRRQGRSAAAKPAKAAKAKAATAPKMEKVAKAAKAPKAAKAAAAPAAPAAKPGIFQRMSNALSGKAAKPAPAARRTAASAPASVEDKNPAGAIAQCKDGTYSHSKTRSGACSRHGGVAKWS